MLDPASDHSRLPVWESGVDGLSLRVQSTDAARELVISEPVQRWSIAGLTLVFGICGALLVLSPQGAYGSPTRMTIGIVLALSTIPVAILVSTTNLGDLWMTKEEPTRALSTWFVGYADVGICTGMGVARDATIALHGTTLLAVVGAFVAHFANKLVVAAHVTITSLAIGVLTIVAFHQSRTTTVSTVFFALVALVAANATVLLVRNHADVSRRALLQQLRWANTDALTTLLNRRGFQYIAASMAKQTSGPFGLAILDIDNYKQINDTHGHAAGDMALARFGAALRTIGDNRTAVARLGGDEFAIAAIADATQLRAIIERARSLMPELLVGEPLTISAGAVVRHPPVTNSRDTSNEFVTDSIAVADRALLHAKRDGRNTVRLIDES